MSHVTGWLNVGMGLHSVQRQVCSKKFAEGKVSCIKQYVWHNVQKQCAGHSMQRMVFRGQCTEDSVQRTGWKG